MKKGKKLTLKKSTIVNLTNPEMGHVVGGGANSIPANTKADNTCYGACVNQSVENHCYTNRPSCNEVEPTYNTCTQWCFTHEIDSYYLDC